MRDVQVLPAIAINVGSIDAHSGFVAAVLTGGNPGDERHIIECAIMLVDEEEVRP